MNKSRDLINPVVVKEKDRDRERERLWRPGLTTPLGNREEKSQSYTEWLFKSMFHVVMAGWNTQR